MSKITIDKLATMIQGEFAAIRGDMTGMATKGDMAGMATKGDIAGMATKKDVARLEGKIDDLDIKLSAQGTTWQQDFDKLDGRVFQNEVDITALNKIVFKKKS